MAQDRERTLTHVETLLRVGRLDAAIAEYVRLVEDEPSDWNAASALGDLYARVGDGPRAVGQFVRVADHLLKEGFFPRAAALYRRILRLDDRDEHARLCLAESAERQGLLAEARTQLRSVVDGRLRSGDTRGAADVAVRLAKLNARDTEARGPVTATDPRILVAVARMEFERGHVDRGRAAMARWLAQKPERPGDLLQLARGLERDGLQDAAFACVDLVADQAQREGDWSRAAAALSAFVDRVPDHLNALLKLVEVCADGRLDGPMLVAQARLADAYLMAGRAVEARAVAEDLVARAPIESNIDRFRRVLAILGTPDAETLLADLLKGSHEVPVPDAGEPSGGMASAAVPETEQDGGEEDSSSSDAEMDLSGLLADLSAFSVASEVVASELAPDLEEVFERLRSGVAAAVPESSDYDVGLAHMREGRLAAAMAAFEAAARVPTTRFVAAARLGECLVADGDARRGIEWLELAVEAHAPDLEQRCAVQFTLADALEQTGERARALTVLLSIEAQMPIYRDVAIRIERLSGSAGDDRGA